jgi:hypothetical protein
LWRRIVDYPLVAMLIAIALFIAAIAAGLAIARALPPMDATPRLVVQAVINIALVVAVYKLAIAKLGERPRDQLKLRHVTRGLSVGLLLGFVLFSLIVGVAAVADVYNIVGDGGTRQLLYLLIAASVVPSFMEELFFRGILFRWLEEFAGTWAGLILSSLAFGFAHYGNPNATVVACLWIAVEAGVLLGGAYMLTRSLWMPIGLHIAWNFTQGFIFDVPVSGLDQEGLVEARLSGPELLSGGAFGLEASIIALAIATAAGVGLVVLAIKRGQLMQPRWLRSRIPSEV